MGTRIRGRLDEIVVRLKGGGSVTLRDGRPFATHLRLEELYAELPPGTRVLRSFSASPVALEGRREWAEARRQEAFAQLEQDADAARLASKEAARRLAEAEAAAGDEDREEKTRLTKAVASRKKLEGQADEALRTGSADRDRRVRAAGAAQRKEDALRWRNLGSAARRRLLLRRLRRRAAAAARTSDARKRLAADAEKRLATPLPNRNLLLRILPPAGTDVAALLKKLQRKFGDTGPVEQMSLAGGFRVPQSGSSPDDLVSEQKYLLSGSEGGVGAIAAWACPGGNGAGVQVADVEPGFDTKHPDLPEIGIDYNPDDCLSCEIIHGTGSLGILGARAPVTGGVLGVTGICHGATLRFASTSDTTDPEDPEYGDVLDALDALVRKPGEDGEPGKLGEGDVLLLEMETVCGEGFFGPPEFRKDIRDLLTEAIADGIVVVQAAGNGNQSTGFDLKKYDPDGIWNPDCRTDQTGTIIVGAGWSETSVGMTPRSRRTTSNYGKRVDCQGWGNDVATTGGGDLANIDGVYWQRMSDTSAAAAMVAGVVACIQGAAKEAFGAPLLPARIRELVSDPANGSPQPDADAAATPIGPLPDLAKLLAAAGIKPDTILRDHLPSLAGERFDLCPDIQPRRGALVDPAAALGPDHWDDPDSGIDSPEAEDREVYVRVRNGGNVPDSGVVVLYATRPSPFVPPSAWILVGEAPYSKIKAGGVAVLAPIGLAKARFPCTLVAVIQSNRGGEPAPTGSMGTKEYLEAVEDSGRIGIRNRVRQRVAPGSPTKPFRMEIRGIPEGKARFRFVFTPDLPAGSSVGLDFPGGVPTDWPAELFVDDQLTHTFADDSELGVEIELFKDARIPVDVSLSAPADAAPGTYRIAVDQYLIDPDDGAGDPEDLHLGRFTLFLAVGGP